MSVVSLSDIKSDLALPEAATADLLALLMEGIGRHAIDEDQDDLRRFQERVAIEVDRMKTTGQMRPPVDAVIELMAQHNDSVKTDHLNYASELAKSMRMMVETIAHFSKSSHAAVHQLGLIEKNLTEATASNDATKLRNKLGFCLKMIREQGQTLQTQTDEQLSNLKSFVASSPVGQQQVALMQEPVDAVTGLPTRAFAENMIQEKLAGKIDCMVGMVTVTRFSGLKERFGEAAVVDLIKAVVKQLSETLPEATTLCRWSANSFVAISEIVSSYAEVSQQWRRVNGLKVQQQIEDETRSALVVLNTSMMVEHLRPLSSKRALIQNLDRFVAIHSGEVTV